MVHSLSVPFDVGLYRTSILSLPLARTHARTQTQKQFTAYQSDFYDD
jgi:hypothetical protein